MKRSAWFRLALVLIIPGLVFTMACAKQTVKQAEEPMVEEAVVVQEPEPEPEPVEVTDTGAEEQAMMMARSQFENEHIYFAFDKSNIDAAAQEVLMRKAEFLKENPNIYFTIEGHTDERGTNEYNLGLGERRAESTKSFLVDLGIEAYRISTVSYGEERPLCMEQTEECWAKNRRAAFVIN